MLSRQKILTSANIIRNWLFPEHLFFHNIVYLDYLQSLISFVHASNWTEMGFCDRCIKNNILEMIFANVKKFWWKGIWGSLPRSRSL